MRAQTSTIGMLNDRLNTIITELNQKCNDANTDEFEYYWEYFGYLWHPWTIEINGKWQTFSLNDISSEDLEELCSLNYLDLVKDYSDEEMEDEFDRKRYRLTGKIVT